MCIIKHTTHNVQHGNMNNNQEMCPIMSTGAYPNSIYIERLEPDRAYKLATKTAH